MAYLIGVDIGGTFTDCIVIDDSGTVTLGKAASTPPDFQTGFVDSMKDVARRLDISLEQLLEGARVYHGCTVGTNALVENRTAKVGLLTTRGHADVMFAMDAGGRLTGMPPQYVAHVAAQTKPDPLVPKHLVAEIDERVAFDGKAVVELNEDSVRAAIAQLVEQGAEAFAISLLWSVSNDAHERRLRELVEEAVPDGFISISSEVIPRTGEYERTVATVVNSLIGPAMNSYLKALEQDLVGLGYTDTLHIMSCSGGLIDSTYAREMPLLTIGSGPVAGLIGAGKLNRAEATQSNSLARDVITTDMGGTTFDVGVIRNGEPLARPSTRHDQYVYFVPTLDVRSVGAGGGSIIRYDDDTATLRVGPESAGARPGPAAYLRGGTLATVTDADLVLGYLNAEFFLGGEIDLGIDASRKALEEAGAPLGFGAEETAAAAGRIVDNQMADAIRLASVQQGYDPREYTMYAYGGAGPVHATAIARELGITKVIVPLSDLASGWSAFGIASADAIVVEELAKGRKYPFDPDELNESWDLLESKVRTAMEGQGIASEQIDFERQADMRYTQQVNQVAVVAPDGRYDLATTDQLVAAFEEEYERLFGADSGFPGAGFALTGLRVRGRARISDFSLAQRNGGGNGQVASISPKGERPVIWYERSLEPSPTPLYDGAQFAPGASIEGPAIVEYVDTTLVLRHGDTAKVDGFGTIVIEVA